MVSVDSYMNLQLVNTEEYIDNQCQGQLGEVLIRSVPHKSWIGSKVSLCLADSSYPLAVCRCNNVLYVRKAPDE